LKQKEIGASAKMKSANALKKNSNSKIKNAYQNKL